MDYSRLVEVFEQLESTSGRLDMTAMIAEFLSTVSGEELPLVLLHLKGQVFPLWSDKEIGIAQNIMIKALEKVSGSSEKEIGGKLRETGDLGLTSAEILVKKAQTTLFTEKLTLSSVQLNLEKMASLSGKGSQERKLGYLTELLSMASPLEGKYIVRLVLGELRLGVGEGIIRDAIAQAYSADPKLVEGAYNLSNDFGEVASKAKKEGDRGLQKISLSPGSPFKVMLAQKAEGIEQVLEDVEDLAFEVKYDGMRVQIHKIGDEITLFTRRLENVSRQFPEVVKYASQNVKAKSAILEGEVVAVKSKKDRSPRPFQDLSRRIKRKYEIERMVKDVPVEANLFDLIFLDGESKVNLPFKERRELLRETVKENDFFKLASQLVSKNPEEINEFYQRSIAMGHEGIMAKNLDAPYQAGSRVGYMYKIKPVMESLDLAITGATWGEGRRAHWLGSFLLSALNQETGELEEIGRMAIGLTDQEFQEMTERLKPLIIKQEGKEANIRPEVVVEVAYEEIQSSPTYRSGYALRFPRLVRVREDKSIGEVDSLARVESILSMRK
ncbi:ATP-dependent DNA ligase [Candidatus Altiarchaeota archaeon]